jgi:hypothetical protein
MSNQNPFFEDDLIASIARDTESVKAKQEAGLKAFLQTQNPKTHINTKSNYKPTLNLSQFMSFNFTHLTKFSIAGLALFSILVGGLSAQALAPDTLKPTQLAQSIKDKYFSANKQSDGDPKVALQGDDTNYVAYLEGCDLGLKYPKLYMNKNIVFEKIQNFKYSSFKAMPEGLEGDNLFTVDCFSQKGKQEFEYYWNNQPAKLTKSVNRDDFIKKTGWFISTDVSDIIYFEKDLIKGYKFNLSDNLYQVSILQEEKNISFADLQLQTKAQIKDIKNSYISVDTDNRLNRKTCENIYEIKTNSQINIKKESRADMSLLELNNYNYGVDKLDEKVQTSDLASLNIQCYYTDSYNVFKESKNLKEIYNIEELPFELRKFITPSNSSNYLFEKKDFYSNELNTQIISYFLIFNTSTNNTIAINLFNEKSVIQNFNLQIGIR